MIAADAPQIWLPPKPAIIRPAEHALLKPGAFRPMTREERRATIADLLRTRRLTFKDAKKATFFTPLVMWPVASAVAPIVVGRTTDNGSFGSGNGSISIDLAVTGSNPVSGNLLIVAFGFGASGSGSRTFTTPSGWTSLTSTTSSGRGAYIFYKVSAGNEGTGVTISHNNVSIANSWGATSFQISGQAAGAPQNGSFVSASGSSPSADPPSVTPTVAASLAIAFAMGQCPSSGSLVSSYPSGYSNGQFGRNTGAGAGFCASAEATIAGLSAVDPPAFSLSGSSFSCWAQTVIVNGA
jgi:hypothetical protein